MERKINDDRADLYQRLYNVIKIAYPEKSKQLIQVKTNTLWTSLKCREKEKGENLVSIVNEEITSLRREATKKKLNSPLIKFLTTPSNSKNPQIKRIENDFQSPSTSLIVASKPLMITSTSQSDVDTKNDESGSDNLELFRPTPAQDSNKKNISNLERQISDITKARDAGFDYEDNGKQLKALREKLATENRQLKKRQNAAERQKKHRLEKKQKLDEVCEKNPEIAKELRIKDKPGKPRLEDEQPELLKAITDIAIFGGAVDDRRRTNLIRSCKTLTQLTEELKKDGFNVSRNGVYIRLLPRRSNTTEGQRHITTVPVKLCRSQADQHRKHEDTNFCFSTIRDLETIASLLGPQQVCFLSQDDKARVPLGITAAKKQAPILMHVEYRVTLPDHDWVVAERHKLIPSVYAGIIIQPNGEGRPDAVGYSGPTYIAIRSGKHSSSSPESHASDLKHLLDLADFQMITKTPQGLIKPILILTVDGGPDENPRYPRVIANAINHFKELNLDALFIATNAPGRSAYNRVERRMAPLSKELAGLLLPYDHFGTHLNNQNETIDVELEKKNFEHAGKILADIWSSMIVDKNPVVAEYIEPRDYESVKLPDARWYYQHVREAQYVLQIVKCDSIDCCGPKRSNLSDILPDKFLVPPYPIQQDSVLSIPETSIETKTFAPLLVRLAFKKHPESREMKMIPYDLYCPSIKSQLVGRSCVKCGLYYASIKSAVKHCKEFHATQSTNFVKKVRPVRVAAQRARELMCIIQSDNGDLDAEWLNTDDVEVQTSSIPTEKTDNIGLPVIESITDWSSNPWTSQKP